MNYNKLFLCIMCFLFVGSGGGVFAGGSQEQEQMVNVYSGRHYDIDAVLYKQFTDSTGIKVNLISGKADELIQRVESEGTNTDMDVLWLVDVGRLYRAKEKGLFQAMTDNSVMGKVPTPYKDKDKMWLGLSRRVRVIVYDKDKGMPNITSYSDLAKSNGPKVLVRSSGNIYNISLIAQMIYTEEEESTEKWVKGLVKNFARPPKGSDRDQMRALAQGLGDVAIVNSYYVGILLNAKDENDVAVGKKMGFIFPKDGVHVNLSGVGISKYSKNTKAAYKLISFLLSKKSQEAISNGSYEYPITEDASPSELLNSWGSFSSVSIDDLNVYGKFAPDATKIADKYGWQ